MSVAGIDLSLTSTGVALVYNDAEIKTHRIKSTGKKGATVASTSRRLELIGCEVVKFATAGYCLPGAVDLAVIEAPSYGSTHGSQHERGGLWWQVVRLLLDLGIPVATVAPQGRAKYATGKGNSGKDDVLAAAIKRYPQAEIIGNDVADAVILAAMGQRWLGRPIEGSLPAPNLLAMDGATWPS